MDNRSGGCSETRSRRVRVRDHDGIYVTYQSTEEGKNGL
jgi:hypothetical protein